MLGPSDAPSGRPETAYAVETRVVEDHGQWAVEIVVLFADEVVRRRIETYRTRALAELSATMIQRAAKREQRGPLHG